MKNGSLPVVSQGFRSIHFHPMGLFLLGFFFFFAIFLKHHASFVISWFSIFRCFSFDFFQWRRRIFFNLSISSICCPPPHLTIYVFSPLLVPINLLLRWWLIHSTYSCLPLVFLESPLSPHLLCVLFAYCLLIISSLTKLIAQYAQT